MKYLPDPHHAFCVSLSLAIPGADDELHILQAERSSMMRQNNTRKIYKEKSWPLKVQHVKGVSGLCSVSASTIIIACTNRVLCLKYNNAHQTEELWSLPTNKAVTDVCQTKLNGEIYLFASIQDENRIVKLDKQGNVANNNILPPDCKTKPDRISIKQGMILVREFNEMSWKNIVQEF